MVNGNLTRSIEELQLSVLPATTKRALLVLSKAQWLKKYGWYLAGGTALALQAGHRQSVDLDFFTKKKLFDVEKLETNLKNIGNWVTSSRSIGTLYGKLFNVKISFIAYPFFRPSTKKLVFGNVVILNPDDIAVMKIIAISQRGRKRDFIDLYWYLKNSGNFYETLSRMIKQYPQQHNLPHIFKSFIYFDEAEKDPDPRTNMGVLWNDVKSFFRRETAIVARQFLQLK